uniref:PA domain-containing protein n=1 Tax=Plectus sambesii TaxID=2011161 RepID=A0A914UWP4_9BILA
MHRITEKVHVAGTPEQMDVLSYLEQTYAGYGLRVKTIDYDVMLSYPNYSNPNTVSMQLANGTWEQISNGLGEIPTSGPKEMLDQISSDQRALNWWNAYSADGSANGTLVYVNYGRIEDFNVLNNSNINLNGKIAVIRYGELFRGDKVLEAWRRGAVGVIIFTDPIDYGSPDLSNTTN